MHASILLRRAFGLPLIFSLASASDEPAVTAHVTSGDGHLVVEAHGVPPPPPTFFTASVDQTIDLHATGLEGDARIHLQLLQGRPETLTLALSGDGEIVSVLGSGLVDWSVRQTTSGRLLDLRLARASGKIPLIAFDLVVRTKSASVTVPGRASLLLFGPGEATGFTSRIAVRGESGLDVAVAAARGLVAVEDPAAEPGLKRFVANGECALEVLITPRGATVADLELREARLVGSLAPPGAGMDFRLVGQFVASRVGARLRILQGRAALPSAARGEGWHVELSDAGQAGAYDLVADRIGTGSVAFSFVAGVRENDDWSSLDFVMPAGMAVPIRLEGLGAETHFGPNADVVARANGWESYVPADGAVTLSWRQAHEAAVGALFFSSTEDADVAVGAGVIRETSRLALRVLQGKLEHLRIKLEGRGDILAVEGENIVGWKILEEGNDRVLAIDFSRPLDGTGQLTVRSQESFEGLPITAEPLRLRPQGGVRHSGLLRVTSGGAVRLEVTQATGLMQLPPAQFPEPLAGDNPRQVFVYRFPSADYDYHVVAAQIQPEVAVALLALAALGETDRTLDASIELDVREAPLREWSFLMPDDYTVVSVGGANVTDFAPSGEHANGMRPLKVLFSQPVDGRQLIQVKLEKNQAAAAGEWPIPALRFPGVKSVRGQVGIVAAPGFRLAPMRTEGLSEVPISYFPRQVAGLQQAWRLHDPEWSATARVEALGQSIQADVFHLYTVREGVVHGSVLLNYFVVGAPATEWRLHVPATVGNLDVVGQNVRRDWHREGDEVVVSLHQPVLGAATLLVTFAEPMSAHGGVIQPGEVRPVGVQAERGYVSVVSPLQVRCTVTQAEGSLLKIESLELPAEFRLLSASPALAVYQYTARPFTLALNIEWYPTGETVDQVVDYAQLKSQVSRDGQVVTEARYFVKTRGRKALRLVLPPGLALWETRVDHETVAARTDGDRTVIPLPARLNPNEPVEVNLRLGQKAGASSKFVHLLAPRTEADSVIDEWSIDGDAGRRLVPRGGTAEVIRNSLPETGYEWLSVHARFVFPALLALLAATLVLLRVPYGWRGFAGLLTAAIVIVGALSVARYALQVRRFDPAGLVGAATMVPAGTEVSLDVANVPAWQAMISTGGLVVTFAGVVLLIVAARTRGGFRIGLQLAGVGGLSAGLLSQPVGAAYFFLTFAVGVATFVVVPVLRRWNRDRLAAATPEPPRSGLAAGASLLLLVGLGGAWLGHPTVCRAESPAPVEAASGWFAGMKPAEAIVQHWSIHDGRLEADAEITVRGDTGDAFLALREPAVLTSWTGDGLRMGKVSLGGVESFCLTALRPGEFTARLHYEMPVSERNRDMVLPTGPAAAQTVTVELDQGGWEIASASAISIRPSTDLAANHSGATLVLGPGGPAAIRLQPRRRDPSSEPVKFFAEVANLFVPGPGVVNGHFRVTVRPVQGRLAGLDLTIPEGFTVGEVARGPVGAWRFDPSTRQLHVAIEPAQSEAFNFEIEAQLGAGSLPFALNVAPLRVGGAASESGLLALAFGNEAQSEAVHARGLSPVNPQDFDAALPGGRETEGAATVQQAWRYGAEGGQADLKIVAVTPEVRVTGRQVMSIDDDRLVMAADLAVSITRAGIFQLSFVLPDGLDVEGISGQAVSQWTEAKEDGRRIITLHLNGRTLGETSVAISLAGPAPHAQAAWSVPHLGLREATRQTGDLIVTPGKGIRLQAGERILATPMDPRSIGGLEPGALAFHLLDRDWRLALAVEALEPWVTVQALQEMTAREGQTLVRQALRFRVENAAVKQVAVILPGLSEEDVRTIRVTGPAVADFVRVPGSADRWEIRFQRSIAGETDVLIEYQRKADRTGSVGTVVPPVFPEVKQVTQFVAVRTAGRLEVEAGVLPRGWSRTDWSGVPAILQDRSDRSMPTLCYRVADPQGPLPVSLHRHEVAAALKLRITSGSLTTLLSTGAASLTGVELQVDVVEKSALHVRLPAGARLYNLFVNGESVPIVREDDAYLFHVTPNAGSNGSASVKLVYATEAVASAGSQLQAPSFGVPLENVSWHVILPPQHTLRSYSGNVELLEQGVPSFASMADYESLVTTARNENARQAVALMEEASTLLQKGDQERAGEVLSRVSHAPALDEASNEDARVQLRNLKTQQTVLGLNTRRQRLYLDNRAESARNELLEQAAGQNPLMQGRLNFNPQELDQLLLGNSPEETTALKGIAARLVDQQLSAEPAPGAIDVTLRGNGRMLLFTRSLQVDGATPLELSLQLGRETSEGIRYSLLAVAILGVIGTIPLWPVTRRI
ncbi:MAG TPA: hypothetical protein VHD32_18395 [Candidatus Didemnitutus sp.]|nr:hypothetical protein [Candidatus Didemnitutus sp.]